MINGQTPTFAQRLTRWIPRRRDGPASYLLTLVLMVLALLLRLAIAPIESGLQYLIFFPVVTLAALSGGYRPGLFATAMGVALATFIFTPPYFSLSLAAQDGSHWSNLIFLADGIIVSFSIEAMHHYRRQYADELKRSGQAQVRMAVLNGELNEQIARRRQAERELCGSASALEAAQRLGGIGNWEWDLQSGSHVWSVQTYRIYGRDPDLPPLGYPEVRQYFTPASWIGLAAAIDQAREAGIPYEYDAEVVGGDGCRRWVTARGEARRAADGQVASLQGTLLDISERKRAELALRDADRHKDEFLSMLGHELRNPLTPISLAAHILEQPGLDPERQRWALTTITGRVDHITRLVDDMLDVSRISRGRITLRRERLPLCDLVERVVDAMRPVIAAKSHHYTQHLPEQPVYLNVDAARISQVLSNILDNAAKYTPKGGHIDLSAQRHGEEVAISVQDDGMGMPAELIPHVFQLFLQGRRTPDRGQGGLGIGMCLAERLMKLHDGRIAAESAGPGQGARFTVWLPVEPDESPIVRLSSRTPAEPDGPRVLVVDDESARRRGSGSPDSSL